MIKNIFSLFCLLSILGYHGRSWAQEKVTIIDERHYSNVFGEIRNYRVFLPPGYADDANKRYPVIYFFHGWSQRYFGSSNPYGDFDKGEDNGGDNIANFVSRRNVIVVKPDGYNRSPDEPYYVRPYNVTPVETYRQFPIYFPELVGHIDAHYKTLADREHRGIAGLSMGGFMTFWIAGKYPHLLSAAGSFCGSPEFVVGPKDFPVEYRHLDMYKNYDGMNVRLHYGDKDFIRGYHQDLNKVWPQVMDNYGFKVFDAAHSTCGLAEMLGFILHTFENPPPRPKKWHHTDVYPVFSVWDYTITTDRTVPGFTVLEKVDHRGFRSSVRTFLPDGELLPAVRVTVKTPPLYEPDQMYTIIDLDMRTLKSTQKTLRATVDGRLVVELDGSIHEVGINKRSDIPNLSITSVDVQDKRWATAGEETTISLRIVNKGLTPGKSIRATLSATRPSAQVLKGEVALGNIDVNKTIPASFTFRVKPDTIEIEKFKLTLQDGKNEWIEFFEIPLQTTLKEIKDFEIADGRTMTVASSGDNTDTLKLGTGNGDGKANPGESIVIVVKDQEKLWRTDLEGKDGYINPFGIKIRKSDYWGSFDHVGGSAKYDVPMISSDCPENHHAEFAVEYWLPDAPLHIIKRGFVRFAISGKDTTPPAMGNIQVTADNVLWVKLYDGSRIKNVNATLTDEKDLKRTFTVSLADDGRGGDRAADDMVFSQIIPRQVFGVFNAVIDAEDSFGNRISLKPDQTFVLQ